MANKFSDLYASIATPDPGIRQFIAAHNLAVGDFVVQRDVITTKLSRHNDPFDVTEIYNPTIINTLTTMPSPTMDQGYGTSADERKVYNWDLLDDGSMFFVYTASGWSIKGYYVREVNGAPVVSSMVPVIPVMPGAAQLAPVTALTGGKVFVSVRASTLAASYFKVVGANGTPITDLALATAFPTMTSVDPESFAHIGNDVIAFIGVFTGARRLCKIKADGTGATSSPILAMVAPNAQASARIIKVLTDGRISLIYPFYDGAYTVRMSLFSADLQTVSYDHITVASNGNGTIQIAGGHYNGAVVQPNATDLLLALTAAPGATDINAQFLFRVTIADPTNTTLLSKNGDFAAVTTSDKRLLGVHLVDDSEYFWYCSAQNTGVNNTMMLFGQIRDRATHTKLRDITFASSIGRINPTGLRATSIYDKRTQVMYLLDHRTQYVPNTGANTYQAGGHLITVSIPTNVAYWNLLSVNANSGYDTHMGPYALLGKQNLHIIESAVTNTTTMSTFPLRTYSFRARIAPIGVVVKAALKGERVNVRVDGWTTLPVGWTLSADINYATAFGLAGGTKMSTYADRLVNLKGYVK